MDYNATLTFTPADGVDDDELGHPPGG